jgi:hypothetical protein
MSKIFGTGTQFLLELAADGDLGDYQIAAWPGPTNVLASDAGTVATTEAVVLWQTLRGVRANGNQITITTDHSMYRSGGSDTFVLRRAS